MAGLVDTIRNAIGTDTIEKLATHLGETPQNTGNALNGAVPVLLAFMANRTESGNAGWLVETIKSALASGNPLDRQDALANPPAPGVAPDDGGLASSLLGSSFGTIVTTLAARFGLKAESLKTLLGVGGLLGAGGIAKALDGNVTPQRLTDLLRRERSGIESALPAGIGGLLGGFGPSTGSTAAPGGAAAAATSGSGRWWPWLLLAVAAIILILLLRTCGQDKVTTGTTTSAVEPPSLAVGNEVDVTTAAPTTPAPAPAIPTGSGVISETRSGKPALIVYFDTAKSDVSKDLSAAAADIRTYLGSHAGATLAVSGFNDPTGNAVANAALSKRRAEEVSKALTATGIPASSIKLEKPADASGTGDTNAQSRRVEVTVRD